MTSKLRGVFVTGAGGFNFVKGCIADLESNALTTAGSDWQLTLSLEDAVPVPEGRVM